METFAYKPTLHEVLPRLKSLYERQATDRVFAAFEVPSAAIAEFAEQYSHGYCDDPDPARRAEFWDHLFSELAGLEDDGLPVAYLSELDQGLYGGLLGGKVQFMAHPENGWISSMVAPVLADWSEFDRLRFDPEHPWFRRYLDQLDTFVRQARGKFGISHFILIDGLNFAFELVGATETYLSLAERPEMIRRAIELAFEINAKVQDTFFARIPLLQGGTCSNMCEWVPDRIVSESVDPFHMTSVEYFETWGREPVERMLGRFDGGVLHLHGNGRHLLEAVCTIRGAKAIRVGDDKGFPQAFDILRSLRGRAGDMPLVVEVEYPRFIEGLKKHELCGGILYKVTKTPDIATANRCMEAVRAYRW